MRLVWDLTMLWKASLKVSICFAALFYLLLVYILGYGWLIVLFVKNLGKYQDCFGNIVTLLFFVDVPSGNRFDDQFDCAKRTRISGNITDYLLLYLATTCLQQVYLLHNQITVTCKVHNLISWGSDVEINILGTMTPYNFFIYISSKRV